MSQFMHVNPRARTEKEFQYSVRQITETVLSRANTLVQCAQCTNLVIFVGPAQIGKRTTINALLGAVFTRNKYDRLELQLSPDSSVPYAPMGDGSVPCTEFPTLYTKEGLPYAFLDTQGFFDGIPSEIASVATSILLEMVLRQAKHVKLICMLNCREFYGNRLRELSYLFSKLIKSSDADVYFLFNRYEPDMKEILLEYFTPSESSDTGGALFTEEQEAKQNQHILDSILKNFRQIRGGFLKEHVEFFTTLARRFGIDQTLEQAGEDGADASIAALEEALSIIHSRPHPDSEFHQLVDLLTRSLDSPKRLFGYIDPTQPQSVARLLRDLDRIPDVSPEKLLFARQSDMLVFNQALNSLLGKETVLLKQIHFALKYGSSLPALIPPLRTKLEDALRARTQLYEGGHPHYESEESATVSRQQQIGEALKTVEKEIADFERRPPIPYIVVSEDRRLSPLEWVQIPVRYPPPDSANPLPYESISIEAHGFEPFQTLKKVENQIFNVDYAPNPSAVAKRVSDAFPQLVQLVDAKIPFEEFASRAETILSPLCEKASLKITVFIKATEMEHEHYASLLRTRDSLKEEISKLTQDQVTEEQPVERRLQRDIEQLEQDLDDLTEAEKMCAQVSAIWTGTDPSHLYATFADRIKDHSQLVEIISSKGKEANDTAHSFLEQLGQTQHTEVQAVPENQPTPVLVEYRTIRAQAGRPWVL